MGLQEEKLLEEVYGAGDEVEVVIDDDDSPRHYWNLMVRSCPSRPGLGLVLGESWLRASVLAGQRAGWRASEQPSCLASEHPSKVACMPA